MSEYERDYCALINRVLRDGNHRNTRNAPTVSTFGETLIVYDLIHGQFPILKGRQMYPHGIFAELAAFLKGPKSVEDFQKEGCNYWNQFADEDGNLNVDYGNAWLDFNGVNQLESVLTSLSQDPAGRRHIITGWRPDNILNLTLPCCHLLYQWYVNGDYLEMIWYQRSVDVMVGLPSDVILAAAWNVLMADQLGLNPGKLVFMLGDTHIYKGHLKNANEYLYSAGCTDNRPVSYFNSGTLYDFDKFSISLIDYEPSEPIVFEVY